MADYFVKFNELPPMDVNGGSYDDDYLNAVSEAIERGNPLDADELSRATRTEDPLNVRELIY